MTEPIILYGNNIDLLRELPDNSIDSIVTDPPYELGFMGKQWDNTGIAYSVELWAECLRVLKHGGHLLSFSGSRTYHRMVVAIEDAGFEIRDQIMWVYGSGFPKSLNISKAIDKAAGAEREVVGHSNVNVYKDNKNHKFYVQGEGNPEYGKGEITAPNTIEAQQWAGWGTALKPAHEPIVMARKSIQGTVANNVLKHGVGGINIDGCRVKTEEVFTDLPNRAWANIQGQSYAESNHNHRDGSNAEAIEKLNDLGRFPANFIHDGSDEVLALLDDAARFFYCAKANKSERNAGLDTLETVVAGDMTGRSNGSMGSITMNKNHHPTVKPLALMRYLVKLVTPINGTVLDPFAGSGSTLVACVLEGFKSVGIEITADYLPIINGRVQWAIKQNSLAEQLELDLWKDE